MHFSTDINILNFICLNIVFIYQSYFYGQKSAWTLTQTTFVHQQKLVFWGSINTFWWSSLLQLHKMLYNLGMKGNFPKKRLKCICMKNGSEYEQIGTIFHVLRNKLQVTLEMVQHLDQSPLNLTSFLSLVNRIIVSGERNRKSKPANRSSSSLNSFNSRAMQIFHRSSNMGSTSGSSSNIIV